jgi:TfoX/Sxy family transcriptional regulator of competence genes
MASRQETVDAVLAALATAGDVTARKMFGEYCVYLAGKPVALVCDDRLFLKPTAAGRELLPGAEEAPPYPGAKPHLVIPAEVLADGERVGRLVQATFLALPAVKKKPPRG